MDCPLERIRIEIVSNLNADAALTLRKKRGFSVCSVAGSRSRDYQSNPHFQCGIALAKGVPLPPTKKNTPLSKNGAAGLRVGEGPPRRELSPS